MFEIFYDMSTCKPKNQNFPLMASLHTQKTDHTLLHGPQEFWVVCLLHLGPCPTLAFQTSSLSPLPLVFVFSEAPPQTSPAIAICSIPASAAAKSLQSCPALRDPIDGSPPSSAVPEILQARTLEWVAISFSNAWKWKVKVAQSCPTLSDPMDCSPPGSSVHVPVAVINVYVMSQILSHFLLLYIK